MDLRGNRHHLALGFYNLLVSRAAPENTAEADEPLKPPRVLLQPIIQRARTNGDAPREQPGGDDERSSHSLDRVWKYSATSLRPRRFVRRAGGSILALLGRNAPARRPCCG